MNLTGKPISLQTLAKLTPAGVFECPDCKIKTDRNDMRMEETIQQDGMKVIFVQRKYFCKCGYMILKMEAQD